MSSEKSLQFIGAGQRNVVFGMPDDLLKSLNLDQKTNGALRVSKVPPSECEECYKGLKPYCGLRELVQLPESLYESSMEATPEKFKHLVEGSKEATVVPNFSADPGQILSDPSRQQQPSDADLLKDFTIEIKPKSVWQRPEIVGIIVDDGEPIYIHPAKLTQCRYSQMLYYKASRDDKPELTEDMTNGFCPNFLFRKELSTEEGFHRLKVKAVNNLKVIGCHPTIKEKAGGKKVHPSEVLGEDDVKSVAAALDYSEIFNALGALQLYGVAVQDVKDDVPMVLDIELLHPWYNAKNKKNVKWLVAPPNRALPCSCTSQEYNPDKDIFKQAVPQDPSIDLETAVERFYNSVTAKDISLLLSRYCHRMTAPDGSKPCERVTDVLPSSGGVFVREGEDLYRVAAVDIDEKKNKSIEHYFVYDRDILKAFEQGIGHSSA